MEVLESEDEQESNRGHLGVLKEQVENTEDACLDLFLDHGHVRLVFFRRAALHFAFQYVLFHILILFILSYF